jgi:hypothetical protein
VIHRVKLVTLQDLSSLAKLECSRKLPACATFRAISGIEVSQEKAGSSSAEFYLFRSWRLNLRYHRIRNGIKMQL